MMRARNVILYVLACAGLFALIPACAYLAEARTAAEMQGQASPSSSINWTNVLLGVIALMAVVRTVLAYTAPRTKTTWDDRGRDVLDELLGAARAIAASRGIPSTTTVIVEQPKAAQPEPLADPPAPDPTDPR
jgi:hypothetical protein